MTHLRQPGALSLCRKRGVALIELIITGVLFLAVAGVTVGTIAKANSTLRASNTATQATALLNRKVAEVRGVSYDVARQLTPGCGTETLEFSGSRKVALEWTRSVQVSAADGVVQIRHSVEWNALGAPRSVEAIVRVPRPIPATLAQLDP